MPDRSDRWIVLMLMAYSLAVLVALLALRVQITDEDGFYYFKIAQQIALGHGSTFDGTHVTNGYHPLWLLCLTPIFWLAPAPEVALLVGTIVQGVLAAAAVGLLYAIVRLMYGRLAASLAVLLWILLTYRISLSGLEYSLHALGLFASAYVYLRWFSANTPRPRVYLGLGLLLSLTFLARIETIALAGLIGLFLCIRERTAGLGAASAWRLLAFATPLIVTVLGYVVFNLWLVGHPLSVSAALKRAWSVELLAHDPRYLAGGWLAAKVGNLIDPLVHLYGVYMLSIVTGTVGAALFGRRTLRPFILYSLLQLAIYAGFYHGALSFEPWYYVVQHLLSALLLAALITWVAAQPGIWLRSNPESAWVRFSAPLLASVALGAGIYSIAWSVSQWPLREQAGIYRHPLLDAAEWARTNLPADAVVGAWNAGTIGYLSQRRVIDLDGVVNSWAYFETERFDLCTYWRRNGVTYILDAFEQREAQSMMPTYPTYVSCAGELELVWSDRRYGTLWRMAAYRIGKASR